MAAGQTITVVVQVAEGASFAAIQIIGEDLGISRPKFAPPYEFPVQIPVDLIGTKKISALGRTGREGGIFSKAVTIDIETSAKLTALRVSPGRIFLRRLGSQIPLIVTGTFDDGTAKDITESSRTRFSSSNPGVVTVDRTGLVTGVGRGKTMVVVSYGRYSTIVPVTVR
ncbi:MAG: Ig-like domain-containing protein [Candidatus Methylomirabilales bacterium]